MIAPRRFARRVLPRLFAAITAACLGLAAALLVSCGSSGKGLIPASYAGPLQGDFEAVQQAAEAGNGSCTATEAAVGKTEEDFRALPATVNAGLVRNLRQGIDNLRVRAHELCAQPAVSSTAATTATTTTTTTPATTTTSTTNTETTPPTTTSTETTPPPTTTSTPPGPGGGTEAPEHESGGGAGAGEGGAK